MVPNVCSDSCHQICYFHDASEDSLAEAADTSSKNEMLEILQNDIEENPRQFKYLWAVFNSSWNPAAHEDLEKRADRTEDPTKTSDVKVDASNESSSLPTFSDVEYQASGSGSARRVEKDTRISTDNWYCCHCEDGPKSITQRWECVMCGHHRCSYCPAE